MSFIRLNTYQRVLLQKLILLEHKHNVAPPIDKIKVALIYDNLKGVVSEHIIGKIFCLDQKEESIASFHKEKLNTLIASFKLKDIKNWKDFNEKINLNNITPNGNSIPYSQSLTDLSQDWQNIIRKSLIEQLSKLQYGKEEIEYLNFTVQSSSNNIQISPKLKQLYLNTTWYAYFYFPLGNPHPQIIRTVIKIFDRPDRVETFAPRDRNRSLNEFSGSVKFDKSETFLIFDLTSKKTGERGVHIKLSVHTEIRPDIALGEYVNIGTGGIGLHSIRLVMQFAGSEPNDLEKQSPKIFDSRDPDFYKIPSSITQYLCEENLNYRHSTTKPIYSLQDLRLEVKNEKSKRFTFQKVRLKRKFQVVLSYQRSSTKKKDFQADQKLLIELKEVLEKELPFEVDDYYLSQNSPLAIYPKSYDFYSNRIYSCEILIAFFFSEGSDLSISELSWAIEAGKKILIFTTNDRKYLPRSVKGKTTKVL